jgi:hypothetical protein
VRFPRASSVPLTARLATSLVVTLHQVRPPLSSVMGGAFARTSEGGRSAALPPSARARTSRGGEDCGEPRHICRPPGRLAPAAEVAGAPELADPTEGRHTGTGPADLHKGGAYQHRASRTPPPRSARWRPLHRNFECSSLMRATAPPQGRHLPSETHTTGKRGRDGTALVRRTWAATSKGGDKSGGRMPRRGRRHQASDLGRHLLQPPRVAGRESESSLSRAGTP